MKTTRIRIKRVQHRELCAHVLLELDDCFVLPGIVILKEASGFALRFWSYGRPPSSARPVALSDYWQALEAVVIATYHEMTKSGEMERLLLPEPLRPLPGSWSEPESPSSLPAQLDPVEF